MTITVTRFLLPRLCPLAQPLLPSLRYFCVSSVHYNKKKQLIESKIDAFEEDKPLNPRQRLKLLVRDYGTSAMVVHISISLFSLGCCYMIVRTGIPIGNLMTNSHIFTSKTAQYAETSGTFAIAYVIHKSLFLLRLTATCGITPYLVKTLRSRGILKPLVDKTKKA